MKLIVSKAERTMIVAALMEYSRASRLSGFWINSDALTELADRLAVAPEPEDDGPEVTIIGSASARLA